MNASPALAAPPPNAARPSPHPLLAYRTVLLMGWQDSLVYRANALTWALWAILPAAALMFVWVAAYNSAGTGARFGGYTLSGIITYYLCVTALRVAITPNFEWETATQIRDGKVTGFIVRPIGFFGFLAVRETSYQAVKTLMMLPVLLFFGWIFRAYLTLPGLSAARLAALGASLVLSYALLTQLKFLIAISAFWFAEAQGLIELWNILANVLGGGLLPLALLPGWLTPFTAWLPFGSLYAFPLAILQGHATSHDLLIGFARQGAWLVILGVLVRVGWRRGLLAYEAYGG